MDGPRIALVLSGGGARGAYEAGVLSYLLGELPAVLGRPVRFSIVSGSSVGAIHACYLAARAAEPEAARNLARIWSAFAIDSVYSVRVGDWLRWPLRTLGWNRQPAPESAPTPGGPDRIPGLFDVGALERLILEEIPWPRIADNVAAGALDAVAVAATDVRSGRTVVFVENRHGRVDGWARDPLIEARAARLGPEHALASAAIPFFFPAIRIGESFFCDGSLRLNTPLAPALRLGADRVLVVGVRHRPPPGTEPATVPAASIGSASFLVGKVLNALLLDRIDYDADRLRLFNEILRQGRRVYGAEFLDRINEVIIRERGAPYRIVEDFFIRPSRDLGAIAAQCVADAERSREKHSWSTRALLRLAAHDAVGEADLLSYLYFDGRYATELVELGRADAASERDRLIEFFR